MNPCHLNIYFYSVNVFSDLEFSVSYTLLPDLTGKIRYGMVASPMKKIF